MALKTSEYIELLNGLKVYFEDHRLTPGMGSLEALIQGYVEQLDGKLDISDFNMIISEYRTASQIQDMIDAATSGSSGIAHDLEQEINRAQSAEQQLSNRVTSTENAINTLNGSGEGSVEAIAAAEVAKAVADAPAAFDTLKEIADWISAHADSASAMNSQIQDNTNDISDLQGDVTDLTTKGAGIKFGVVNGEYGYYDANNVFKVFKNQADTEAAYQSGYDAGYAAGVAATKVGTATAEEVLSGETFTNSTQVGASGSMVNRGSLIETINPGQSYTIPKGYHSGGGSVTANPNQNTGTYTPTTRGASIDMGVNNTYRYVNTTSVPNNNAETYPATSRNAAIDMGQTNTYRYVDTTKVPFNVKLINSDTSNAMKVNGYYYDSSGTKVTVTDAQVAAGGNVTYLCYSDDYQFTCSY
jgi:cell division septum initiation protein DivIVA